MYTDDSFDCRDSARVPADGERSEGSAPPALPEEADAGYAIRPALPDPFVDDLGIEYWIWNGVRLVPAWPDEVARIRAGELASVQRSRRARAEHAARRWRWLRPFSGLGLIATRIWTSAVQRDEPPETTQAPPDARETTASIRSDPTRDR
jgi:hypothetical protein